MKSTVPKCLESASTMKNMVPEKDLRSRGSEPVISATLSFFICFNGSFWPIQPVGIYRQLVVKKREGLDFRFTPTVETVLFGHPRLVAVCVV